MGGVVVGWLCAKMHLYRGNKLVVEEQGVYNDLVCNIRPPQTKKDLPVMGQGLGWGLGLV
jgi:hypothetical protein